MIYAHCKGIKTGAALSVSTAKCGNDKGSRTKSDGDLAL